jgi:hypothetical protein
MHDNGAAVKLQPDHRLVFKADWEDGVERLRGACACPRVGGHRVPKGARLAANGQRRGHAAAQYRQGETAAARAREGGAESARRQAAVSLKFLRRVGKLRITISAGRHAAMQPRINIACQFIAWVVFRMRFDTKPPQYSACNHKAALKGANSER